MTKREFHGEKHYLFMLREYEAIRVRRKQFRGKPDAWDRIEIELDRVFETFYKRALT